MVILFTKLEKNGEEINSGAEIRSDFGPNNFKIGSKQTNGDIRPTVDFFKIIINKISSSFWVYNILIQHYIP